MPRRKSITEKIIKAAHWDNNETVLIRSLREDDTEWIQDQLAEVAQSGTATQPANMKLNLGTTRRLTMLRGIVSWTLCDDAGRILPVSEESLRGLAPEDCDFIYGEINKLNQPMTQDEKKDSSKTVSDGSQEKVLPFPNRS